MESINKKRIYTLLLILVLIIYVSILATHGFELWDTGYITSFAWRIVNNQYVYQDFIYKGPPLSLYLTALFLKILPVSGQFYWLRVINYLMFALQVYFTISGFKNLYPTKLKFNSKAVMIFGFVVSLLNFSPYPWPTTDGLFFASLAFYILSLNTNPKFSTISLVALFSVFSALTKQSFYPIPLLFLGWFLINTSWKKSLYYSGVVLLFLGLFMCWILSITSLDNFLSQITGETTLKQLFQTGILNYFWNYKEKFIYFGLLSSLSILLHLKFPKIKAYSIMNLAYWLAFSIGIFTIVLCFFYEFYLASRLAFLSACIGVFSCFNFSVQSLKYYSTAILLLGISWCSSISLGYPFPILFTTGILLTLILVFDSQFEFLKRSKLSYILPLSLLLLAFSYNKRPYREKYFNELQYDLTSVSQKLKYLKTNKVTSEKLIDLKNIKEKFGNNYIVAPNIPIANYIFNTESKLPADWIINTEINKDPKRFIDIAALKQNYIFLEKSFIEGNEEFMPKKREQFSIITDYIFKNFKKVDETKYFLIYNGKIKNEEIPQIN